MTSLEADLFEATPIYRLDCKTSGVIVGIEYRWNTGMVGVLWRDGTHENAVRVPITSHNQEPD
ncbi:MAG: hypothetical protein WBG95_00745 [Sulfitobacter sp.]